LVAVARYYVRNGTGERAEKGGKFKKVNLVAPQAWIVDTCDDKGEIQEISGKSVELTEQRR
jgi:hypothetical protein